MQKQFHIKGMSCGHCVAAVEKELDKNICRGGTHARILKAVQKARRS